MPVLLLRKLYIEAVVRTYKNSLGDGVIFYSDAKKAAIHQAPKREAFVCRDASLTRSGSRRSRELAPGWQTKGADIHYKF